MSNHNVLCFNAIIVITIITIVTMIITIRKKKTIILTAAVIIITASNSFRTSSIVPNVSRSSIFCLTKILNSLIATLKTNLFTPLHPKIEYRYK